METAAVTRLSRGEWLNKRSCCSGLNSLAARLIQDTQGLDEGRCQAIQERTTH